MVMCCKITYNGVVTFEQVEPTVEALNGFFGGYLEYVPAIIPGHHAYVNEEGKLHHLPINAPATALAHAHRRLMNDVLVGNVIIFGSQGAPNEGDVQLALLDAMRKICAGLEGVTL